METVGTAMKLVGIGTNPVGLCARCSAKNLTGIPSTVALLNGCVGKRLVYGFKLEFDEYDYEERGHLSWMYPT